MVKESSNSNPSFNEDFCGQLEYHLGDTFSKSNRKDLKDFWCDGILWNLIPQSQLSKKSVNDTKKITTKAWIGKDGQSEYEMIIMFGPLAQSAYAKEKSLVESIPDSESMDWIDIDISKNKIVLYLK